MATLYVTQQGATVHFIDGRLSIRLQGRVLQEVVAPHVDGIALFGNVSLTTPAVKFALQSGIEVVYLSSRGAYRGRLQPAVSKNAGLRRKQYQRSLETGFCVNISKSIVAGKIHNARALCRRQQKKTAEMPKCLRALKRTLRLLQHLDALDKVRGYEGSATALYYQAFQSLLDPNWGFAGRRRRPASDPVNALLSFGYTLLYNDVLSAINLVGLDPYIGFLHTLRPGHASLASDLVEEWRTIIVDSLVLTMLNGHELKMGDFQKVKGGVRLNRDSLGKFITGITAVSTVRCCIHAGLAA